MKVVVIVGPAGSSTVQLHHNAKKLRRAGPLVRRLRLRDLQPERHLDQGQGVAQGANVLIYLGHGNGYPSPYGAVLPYTKDGLGLNPSAGNGHNNTSITASTTSTTYINLAPNAVVILNRLCYASGNSEWGHANPTKSVAIQRVDNYGAGFMRANAKAVFAEGHNTASYILHGLFKTKPNVGQIFWTSPAADGRYDFMFRSTRTRPWHGVLDPQGPSRYYRSLFGDFNLTTAQWRGTAGSAEVTR